MLTSAIRAADDRRTEYGRASCCVVGEDGFDRELRAAGLSPAAGKADVVVIGLDRFLTYAKLDAAVKGGSRLPPELQLERTLVEITRPAERAG